MKTHIILLIGITFLIFESKAQTYNVEKDSNRVSERNVPPGELIEPIATDRPDQTESPYLVPKGMFQLETGMWMENDKVQDIEIKNKAFNTSLFKLGVSDQFELRLIMEYLGTKLYKGDSIMQTSHGFNSIAVGTKIFISEEHGIIPKTSLIAHLQLPYIGNKEFRPSYLAPRFRFVMQNTISDRISIAYNIGAEWDGDSQSATGIYTVSCAFSLAKGLGMFIEGYGFMTENSNEENKFNGTFSNDHRLDGGFTYQIQKNLQIDISGGIGLSANSPDNFLSAGVSWRFPK